MIVARRAEEIKTLGLYLTATIKTRKMTASEFPN